MKVLITGALGMLGRALADVFQGDELSGLVREESKSDRIKLYACDITEGARVRQVVDSLKPDVVIHGAAYTDVDGCERDRDKAFRVNFEGTKNLVDAVGGMKCFFIFISTDYVFDGSKKGAYTEEDSTRPLSVYGQSKLKAEEYIRSCVTGDQKKKYAAHFLMVRTSWLYGKGGRNFVDTMIRLGDEKASLDIVSDQRGRPTYTVDLAKALKRVVLKYPWKNKLGSDGTIDILHIANSGETTWADFAEEIFRLMGKKIQISRISSQELNRPAPRPANSVLNTSRYEKLTGDPLRSWKEALREYLKSSQGGKVL